MRDGDLADFSLGATWQNSRYSESAGKRAKGMAGIIPALLLGLSLVILVLYIAHRDNFPKGEQVPFSHIGKIALDAVWGMGWIVYLILYGIQGGFHSATDLFAIPVLLIGPPIALLLFGLVAGWAFRGFKPD